MKLETFFEKFDRFADAPDAVDEFRKIILRLAVQGSLVDQSDEDEPASDMLQRLIGRQPVFLDAEALPTIWCSVALGDLITLQKGKKPSSLNTEGVGLPYLDIAALERGELRQFTEDDKCPRAALGDLVIVCDGSRSGLVLDGVAGVLGSTVSKIEHAGFVRDYLRIFLRSLYDDLNGAKKGAAIPHLNIPRFLLLSAPIPPLAEQKRIVAKVDELMALCDRLEAQQQERETRHAALARASLARFADAPTPANLNFLFHPSYTIPPSDLRKSILTLAVQGKLVSQDPNDKPAEEREAVAPLTDNAESEIEPPFALPDSWQAARVRDVLVTRQGVQIEKAEQLSELQLGYKRYLYISDFKHDQKLKFVRDEHPTKEVTVDDLVMANTAGPGEVFRGVPGILSNNLFKISFAPEQFCQAFLFIYFTSPCFVEAVGAELKGGAQQHLGHKLMGKQFIAIPPLAEQRRIVAKVDQLMALVDELETRLAVSRATAEKLMEAVVSELTT
jgi:type I restriction enzyme S subunit